MLHKGLVLQAIKDNFLVKVNNKALKCAASQKINFNKIKIICGDYVELSLKNNFIHNVLIRKNTLTRPKVANVDKVFITTSLHEPKISTLFLDKMILFYSQYNVEIIIIFTKFDLGLDKKNLKIINEYKNAGYECSFTTENIINKDFFKKHIKDNIVIFAGLSGVGKTSIINKLDLNLKLKTNPVSKALNRGKHTTTKSTLFPIYGGFVCDTPGFSKISYFESNRQQLANLFYDFKVLSNKCKFNNCIHLYEKHCNVKANVSNFRYKNYVKIIKELRK